MSKTSEISLWLHDQQCASGCTGAHRSDHARRTQTKKARAYASAETRGELARLLHAQMCTVWAQRAHGAHYIDQARKYCGEDGARHIDHLETSEVVSELAKLLGL